MGLRDRGFLRHEDVIRSERRGEKQENSKTKLQKNDQIQKTPWHHRSPKNDMSFLSSKTNDDIYMVSPPRVCVL